MKPYCSDQSFRMPVSDVWHCYCCLHSHIWHYHSYTYIPVATCGTAFLTPPPLTYISRSLFSCYHQWMILRNTFSLQSLKILPQGWVWPVLPILDIILYNLKHVSVIYTTWLHVKLKPYMSTTSSLPELLVHKTTTLPAAYLLTSYNWIPSYSLGQYCSTR